MLSRVIRPDRAAVVVWTGDGFGLDGDRFLQRRRLRARWRAAPTRSVERELDAFLLVGLEPADRDRDVVVAGEQVGEQERAVRAGHRFARQVGAGVLEDDGGARQHAAARVGDRAGNLAGQSLRLHVAHRPADRDEQRDGEHDPAKTRSHVALLPCAVDGRRFAILLGEPHSAGCPFTLCGCPEIRAARRLRPLSQQLSNEHRHNMLFSR